MPAFEEHQLQKVSYTEFLRMDGMEVVADMDFSNNGSYDTCQREFLNRYLPQEWCTAGVDFLPDPSCDNRVLLNQADQ